MEWHPDAATSWYESVVEQRTVCRVVLVRVVAQAEEARERTVRVRDLELSREAGASDIAFRIVGSKGVHVQALMQDLVRLSGLSSVWLSIPDPY